MPNHWKIYEQMKPYIGERVTVVCHSGEITGKLSVFERKNGPPSWRVGEYPTPPHAVFSYDMVDSFDLDLFGARIVLGY